MQIEDFKLKGSMQIVMRRGDGSIDVVRKDNMIVDSGFDFIADAIGNSTRPGAMNYIAVGTDATAVAAAQAALVAELSRISATYTHTAGTKTFTIETTFDPGVATGAITEAGVFNAAAAGSMLDRVTFAVINKGADDAMTVTFTFTMS